MLRYRGQDPRPERLWQAHIFAEVRLELSPLGWSSCRGSWLRSSEEHRAKYCVTGGVHQAEHSIGLGHSSSVAPGKPELAASGVS